MTTPNPYHKPAGHHKPVVSPPPIHTLSAAERFVLMLKDVPFTPLEETQQAINQTMTRPYQPPTVFDYLRAHQYLYYCLCTPVLTDYQYDMFGRDSGEDYKGGSDNPKHYSSVQADLARKIHSRQHPMFPPGFQY